MPPKAESPLDVQRWFQKQVGGLWPAGLGSLSLRRSPCIREHCRACLSGRKHLSHVLYGRRQGRRFAIYVPEELVARIQQCLDNGRTMQDLLYQTVVRYTKALKQQRGRRAKKG